MTASNPITDLLSAPLRPDWTVEQLAEQALDAIASENANELQEFVLDADSVTNRQARRLLRPLLACLATKAQTESGIPVSLYSGSFVFERSTPNGTIWVLGSFENQPGRVRVTFRRCNSSPKVSNAVPVSPVALADADAILRT